MSDNKRNPERLQFRSYSRVELYICTCGKSLSLAIAARIQSKTFAIYQTKMSICKWSGFSVPRI